MSGSISPTTLAGSPSEVIDTNNDEPATHNAAPRGGWTSEAAEMPSDKVITPSPHDGLYHCQCERCEQLKSTVHKCELR